MNDFQNNFQQGGRGGDRKGGFRQGGRGGQGGQGGQGGRKDFGNRGSRPPMMHAATCSSCGSHCEVPFRPTGDRPVYCQDCFADRGPSRTSQQDTAPRAPQQNASPQREGGNAGNDGLKKQLVAINEKLEQLILAVQALGPVADKMPTPAKVSTKASAKTPAPKDPAPAAKPVKKSTKKAKKKAAAKK